MTTVIATVRTLRRAVALALLPPYLAGCTTWQAQLLPPAEVIATGPPTVRLVLRTGDTVEVRQPQIGTDSVRGLVRSLRSDGLGAEFHLGAVPVAAVARVDTRRFSGTRTTFLVVGIAAGVGAVVAVGYGLGLATVNASGGAWSQTGR